MPYEADVSRRNPALWVLLVDHGPNPWYADSTGPTKIANIANELIRSLVLPCVRQEGVLDRYYVALLEYGKSSNPRLNRFGKDLIPISEVADNPIRVETKFRKCPDGSGGLIEEGFKVPVWIEPRSEPERCTCSALSYAAKLCEEWIRDHPGTYPPTVINITGGEPTDGDPRELADRLKAQSGSDGNVLLYNIYMPQLTIRESVVFSNPRAHVADKLADMLFDMSSVLPVRIRDELTRQGYTDLTSDSRGFAINSTFISHLLVMFLCGDEYDDRPLSMRFR